MDVNLSITTKGSASALDFSNITSMWSKETPQLSVTNVLSAFDHMLVQVSHTHSIDIYIYIYIFTYVHVYI